MHLGCTRLSSNRGDPPVATSLFGAGSAHAGGWMDWRPRPQGVKPPSELAQRQPGMAFTSASAGLQRRILPATFLATDKNTMCSVILNAFGMYELHSLLLKMQLLFEPSGEDAKKAVALACPAAPLGVLLAGRLHSNNALQRRPGSGPCRRPPSDTCRWCKTCRAYQNQVRTFGRSSLGMQE